jgi:shikimate kinase
LASRTVRPIIEGKTRDELVPFITRHLSEREPFYLQSDIIVNTDKLVTKEHVSIMADRVIEKLTTLTT